MSEREFDAAVLETRAGRFSEALKKIRDCEGRLPLSQRAASRVLAAELLQHTGSNDEARIAAFSLLRTGGVTPSIASRCHIVIGSALVEEGLSTESLQHLRKGIHLAQEANDASQLCWSQLKLASTLADLAPSESLSTLLNEIKRNVSRAGDAHILARMHNCFALIEAKAGFMDRAGHHLELATSVLSREPNYWLEGLLWLGMCAACHVNSEFEEAIRYAERAMEAANASGHARTYVGAIANLAQVHLYLGHMKSAEQFVQRGLQVASPSLDLRLALLDTYAQLKLAQNKLDECEQALEEMRQVIPAGGFETSWVELWSYQTHTRLLQKRGRHADADRLGEEGTRIAATRSDRLLGPLLQVLRADSLVMMDRIPEAAPLLAQAAEACHGSPLETVGEIERVRAKAFARLGRVDAARLHFQRALRIFDTVGSACLHENALADRQASASPGVGFVRDDPGAGGFATTGAAVAESASPLGSVALLLDVAANPALLGHEAFALLCDSASVRSLRLIAQRGNDDPEVLASWGPGRPGEIRIEIGAIGDREFVILVDPVDEFGAMDAVVAVRKLVDGARSLERYRQEQKQRASVWELDPPAPSSDGIFISVAMTDLLTTAIKIAPTTLPVLLTGETGTGKELLARAIHRSSNRVDRPFLPFNCNSVPQDMLDSQLFGHRRGAFTGAVEQFAGVIRGAAGGTLFLDEIGELSLDLQPKLLRFLETREVHPLGESQPTVVDVRIVAATNANIDRLVSEGKFREDLFYRLNVVRFRMPPLRERREEIPALAQHFLDRFGEEMGKAPPRLTDDVLEYLLLYGWPGNVRQLANEMRRLVAFGDGSEDAQAGHLSPEILASRRTVPASPGSAPSTILVPIDQTLAGATEYVERAMISRALTLAQGRLETAAKTLGISRKGLYLKRLRLGLDT